MKLRLDLELDAHTLRVILQTVVVLLVLFAV